MVAGLMALGFMYAASWVVRQTPKVLSLSTGALLLKEKSENENLRRIARLGFDIVRNIEEMSIGNQTFHLIEFSDDYSHPRLQFLRGKKLILTDEEAFFLSKAIESVESGEAVVPVNFNRFIEISEARFNDELFMEAISSKTA
jgi:hypothetical protein